MGNVIGAAPQAWAVGQQVWASLSTAAVAASALWATASMDCKSAIVFATNTCVGGRPPVAFTPGFGPIALGWGWLLVGVCIGVLVGLHFWTFVDRTLGAAIRFPSPQRNTAPGLQIIPPWHEAVREALVATNDAHRRIVLQRLLEDGDAALDMLAAGGGMSRRSALARMVGENVVQANALAWGL